MAKSKEISKLTQHFRQTRKAFYYALLFSFVMNIFMLFLPIYSLQVLDRVMSSRSMETLIMMSLLAIVAFIFYGIFSAIRSYVLDCVNEWIDQSLSPQLLTLSVNKSALGLQGGAGQLQRELQYIKQFITGGLPVLLDTPWAILFLIVIVMVSPVLGLLAVIGGIVLLGLAWVNELATKRAIEKSQELANQNNHTADLCGRNAEAIESMGMLPNLMKRWNVQMREGITYQNLSNKRTQLVQSTAKSFRMLLQIGMIGIGAYLVINNSLTVGGMIACSILSGKALAPFDNAISIWKSLVAARDSYRKLEEEMENTPDLRGTMELPPPSGNLEIDGLFYAPPQTPPILRNVAFNLGAGETLGIIGPSAAGKSTLGKLLVGVLPPSHGAVRMDGADIFKWSREDVGRYIGYMPQHVDLFDGTIRDNIARMDENADNQRVFKAAQMAGVHEMILRLEKGYETEYSQHLYSLSPGQRQRIALARALYGDPKFVLLDEPNSNLDSEGEKALLDSLIRIKEAGITLVIIAHKPSLVRTVDKILMLREGMIESVGPRDQVLPQYTEKPSAQHPSGVRTINTEKPEGA